MPSGYKYCFKKFNPKFGCRTLMLSTTRYFQMEYEKEPNLINDSYEGYVQITNKGKLLGGKLCPSNYIYCISDSFLKIDETQNAFGINYDSYFKIKDISAFFEYLGDCLADQILHDDFIDNSTSNYLRYWTSLSKSYPYSEDEKLLHSDIFFWISSAKVEYFPLKEWNGYKGIQIEINDLYNIYDRIACTNCYKPEEYRNQHEVRGFFVPYVSDNHNIIPNDVVSIDYDYETMKHLKVKFLEVKNNRKIIHVPDIMKYIE